jgi:GDPmannose 4,6-dehydratase
LAADDSVSELPPRNGRRALLTGITGQDGSYLCELLLSKGYEVFGVIRRSSSFNTGRIDHLYQDPHDADVRLRLVFGDLTDASSINHALKSIRPDEVYNLGAQSHVRVSFDIPEYTAAVTGMGAVRVLESMRELGLDARFYQASSSEMFGAATEIPQSELTPLNPRSPYAAAKAYAYHTTRDYRDAYGFFAVNGILFNHESPRRGENFVTRKITRSATRIKLGLQQTIALGNLDARRDWGFAGDYVEAMWLMLQQDQPDDYVISTGEAYSVREFLEVVFDQLKLKVEDHLVLDERFLRPSEVDLVIGDSSHARQVLNWQPKVKFEQLAEMMVESDLELAERELRQQKS